MISTLLLCMTIYLLLLVRVCLVVVLHTHTHTHTHNISSGMHKKSLEAAAHLERNGGNFMCDGDDDNDDDDDILLASGRVHSSPKHKKRQKEKVRDESHESHVQQMFYTNPFLPTSAY